MTNDTAVLDPAHEPRLGLITRACRDPRISATAAAVLAFVVLELFRGMVGVPMPVKSQALSETLKRSARTVSHALESLVAIGYLVDHGRDGQVRRLALPTEAPVDSAVVLSLGLPRRFHGEAL